jgi:hypothetical protein
MFLNKIFTNLYKDILDLVILHSNSNHSILGHYNLIFYILILCVIQSNIFFSLKIYTEQI